MATTTAGLTVTPLHSGFAAEISGILNKRAHRLRQPPPEEECEQRGEQRKTDRQDRD